MTCCTRPHILMLPTAFMLLSYRASADTPQAWVVGPSLAYAGGWSDSGVIAGLDFTYARQLDLPIWFSAGLRALCHNEQRLAPYVEAGISPIVNLGAGYSVFVPVSSEPMASGPHLFFGLPIPVADCFVKRDDWCGFIEPYGRINFVVQGETLFEGGVLAKVAWLDGQWGLGF